jgi:c-di-GMP-binding flagellar brake protein YcgR
MGSEPHQERRSPRFRVNLDATVYVESATVRTRITSLSLGGCLVYPPLSPTPSTVIRLSFLLPDGATSINCKGEIVYTIHDRGTGIAFTEISQYHQERIAEFFEGQPA